MGSGFILDGVEGCVSGRDVWRATQSLLMRFDRVNEQIRVTGALCIHGVVSDDLVLGFLYLDHLAELCRFTRLAFANDLGGRLEDTCQLLSDMRIATEDPLLGLPHHLLYPWHNRLHFLPQAFQSGLPHHLPCSLHPVGDFAGKSLGLSHYATYTTQKLFVSLL